LGYPTELVDSIVKPLLAECGVKQVLDEGASATTGKAFVDKVMIAGHSLQLSDQRMAQYAEHEIVNVIDQEMGQLIKMQDVIDSFKQYGVLSTFAAKLYNKLVKGSAIAETDKQAILDKTLRGFSMIEKTITSDVSKFRPAILSKMQSIFTVKDQILAMIADR
jgi:hypothetical protein